MGRHKKSAQDVKPQADRKADPRILSAVRDHAQEGEIACAVAFVVAQKLKVSPAEVGSAADELGVRLTRCQLGLFGYRPVKRVVKPAESVAPKLGSALGGGLSNQRLPCKTAWEIAESLGMEKMEVASACETLKIKIGPCQLGAF